MDNIKIYTIYKYTNIINGMSYIGQTSQTLKKRSQFNGCGYNGCSYFGPAIKEYGWENFRSEILATTADKKEANYLEWFYTTKLNTQWPNGYNDKAGWEHSKRTKDLISEAQIGKFAGENNPMFGVHRFGENNPMFGVHRYGTDAPNYGKHRSKESKIKISKANTGKHWYTNGVVNAYCFDCPEGFYPGQVRLK